MKKILFILFILLLNTILFAKDENEIYRIRVENSVGGLVQVSLDGGDNYYAVGSVLYSANKFGQGFMASSYIESGCVCAVASHALRVKISSLDKYNKDFKSNKIFSIVPKEFMTIPKGYGGYSAPNSAIYTDIHTGTGIFLNFAPFPETKVYEEINGNLRPLTQNHSVNEGNIYVIPVLDPKNNIDNIDFENIKGGNIIVNDKDLLSKVVSPLGGVGRYDGTTYNAPGQINTAHGGVITVATSQKFPFSQKEGDKPETRGGFMIQPFYHAKRQNEIKPQVMTIGEVKDDFDLEGTAPLYSSNINLWYYPEHLESSYYVQLKVDDRYINVPTITGKVDNAFTKEYLNKNFNLNLKEDIKGIRINIPKFNKNLAEEYLLKISNEYNKKEKNRFKDESEYFKPSITLPNNYNFSYYIDGKFKGMTNNIQNISVKKSDYVKGMHHFLLVSDNLKFSDYFYSE